MNARLLRYLAAMPVREFYLLTGGLVLVAAALLFITLQKPLKELHAVRAEQTKYRQMAHDGASLARIQEQLLADVDLLSAALPGTDGKRTLEQLAVHVVGELNRLSIKRRVTLGSVVPGSPRKVLMFVELPFDVGISGSYGDIIGWLQDIESSLPGVSVSQMDLQRHPGGGLMTMKARIVLYQEGKTANENS